MGEGLRGKIVYNNCLLYTSMNGEYMKRMDPDRFYERALPLIRETVGRPMDYKKIAGMVQTRIEVFPDIPDLIDFLKEVPEYDSSMSVSYTHLDVYKRQVKKLIIDKALILVLLVMIVGIIIIEPSFLQWRVVTDIMTQSAVKLICALGLMFPLLIGGTDLAGGRQVGLAAVIVASLSQMMDYSNRFWPDLPELPIIVPVLAAVAVVALIGAANGFMISKLKMAPFIATFGMSTIVYGINCLYFAKKPNNSQPIGGIREDLTFLSSYKLFGQVSLLVVIAIVMVAVVWFLLNKTVFGKNIYIV